MQTAVPSLLTPGRLADELGVSLPRVTYILRTRRHIQPRARAGTLRLYSDDVLPLLRYELNLIDAKRSAKGGGR